MDARDGTLSVALLAVPESTASTIYGMYDLFSSVARDWDLLTKGSAGAPRVKPMVVAAELGGFRAANGVWIQPDCAFDACAGPDVVCIPDLFVAPGEAITGRYPAAVRWLSQCHAAGATIASACSGALIVAEAGLLDGCDATTHWGYCDALSRAYPGVRVHPARALVASGDGQRIITAGGGTSWQDLALFLVARFFGLEEAMQVAKVYLMDWHRHGQLPFSALARSRQTEDQSIATIQEWIAEHYREAAPVAAMATRSGLAERSFKRRFTKSTGMSPMEYVHTLRLEEAKQVLETTGIPVEAVANEVGYEDASFFRRLFRRKVGLTPVEYRRRFGSFREALQAAAVDVGA